MYFEKLLGVSEIPAGARIIQREAVRGVVLKEQKFVFMIHTANGDYKFPGGGIEEGEKHFTTLNREFIEETGYAISNEIQPIGLIVEQKQDAYEPNAYFVMKSYYYRCETVGENQGQKLDEYEKEMDFKAEYVSIFDAYKQNKQLLKVGATELSPWVERERIALGNIIEQFNIQD